MNIFGIGPIEFIVIIVLGLVIFGPERLPGIGRSVGKMVARVLAWQYTSPEAQLLMELRRDLEKEITDIRDEMIRARDALDIRPEIEQTLRDAQEAVRGAEVAIRAPQGATVAAAAPNAALLDASNGTHPAADAPSALVSPSGETLFTIEQPAPTDIVSPGGETLLTIEQPAEFASATDVVAPDFADFPQPPAMGVPQLHTTPDFADFPQPPAMDVPRLQTVAQNDTQPSQPYVNGAGAPVEAALAPQPIADFDLLVMQIQSLANDVAAMREQLRRNGLLDADWEPTSALLNGQGANGPVAVGD